MKGDLVRHGSIIAAGRGLRFRQAGWTTPKPMVAVGGIPLIEHVIRHFLAVGTSSLSIVLNEQDRRCADWVRSRFPDLDLRVIVKTTRSSLESFGEVLRENPAGGRMLISTVDAWLPDEDFVRFVQAACRRPSAATVLAVTPFVADERPLWAVVDPAGRVTSLGDASGGVVTAGIYLVSERTRTLALRSGFGSLREFLVWLVEQGELVEGIVIPAVVDVDGPEDVRLAEAWMAGDSPASIRPGGGAR